MNEIVNTTQANLVGLVSHAAALLDNAKGAAEILDAQDMASVAYDAAKKAARLGKAKGAYDEIITAVYRNQADALEIESLAKRRIADEYDAAQERGEVAGPRDGDRRSSVERPTAEDIGLTRKQIHEARTIRDAEENEPGIVRRVLDDAVGAGDEPTKAKLREAVVAAAMRGVRGGNSRGSNKNPLYVKPTASKAAWRYLAGDARALVEWATPENIELAHEARRSEAGSKLGELDLRAVRQCSEILLKFLETANVE